MSSKDRGGKFWVLTHLSVRVVEPLAAPVAVRLMYPPSITELTNAWNEALNEAEQQLLIRRFGLDGRHPRTFTQIAHEANASVERTRLKTYKCIGRLSGHVYRQRHPVHVREKPHDEIVELLRGTEMDFQSINALKKNEIYTLEQLRSKADQLESMPWIGPKTARRIHEVLATADK